MQCYTTPDKQTLYTSDGQPSMLLHKHCCPSIAPGFADWPKIGRKERLAENWPKRKFRATALNQALKVVTYI